MRSRRLAGLLRTARTDVGLTADEAAKSAGLSPSTVTRFERGESIRPKLKHIEALLDVYDVHDDGKREYVLDLARRASLKGWWTNFEDVFTGSFPDFEQEASLIRAYEPLVVPGLFQTPAYAAEVARTSRIASRREIERHVATRKKRQEVLTRTDPPAPQMWALIDEGALIRVAGSPSIMREQYQRLIEVVDLPNVGMQIVPLSAGLHSGMSGQFVILDFDEPTDDPLVYVEGALDGLFREKMHELARYTLMFDYLRADALSVDASVAWLEEKLAQFE